MCRNVHKSLGGGKGKEETILNLKFYTQPKHHSSVRRSKYFFRNTMTWEVHLSHTAFEKFVYRYSNRKQDPRKSGMLD